MDGEADAGGRYPLRRAAAARRDPLSPGERRSDRRCSWKDQAHPDAERGQGGQQGICLCLLRVGCRLRQHVLQRGLAFPDWTSPPGRFVFSIREAAAVRVVPLRRARRFFRAIRPGGLPGRRRPESSGNCSRRMHRSGRLPGGPLDRPRAPLTTGSSSSEGTAAGEIVPPHYRPCPSPALRRLAAPGRELPPRL